MERELFDLDILVGNWESINLDPTVMIHRNGESHCNLPLFSYILL